MTHLTAFLKKNKSIRVYWNSERFLSTLTGVISTPNRKGEYVSWLQISNLSIFFPAQRMIDKLKSNDWNGFWMASKSWIRYWPKWLYQTTVAKLWRSTAFLRSKSDTGKMITKNGSWHDDLFMIWRPVHDMLLEIWPRFRTTMTSMVTQLLIAPEQNSPKNRFS